jgi:hypothetical protein
MLPPFLSIWAPRAQLKHPQLVQVKLMIILACLCFTNCLAHGLQNATKSIYITTESRSDDTISTKVILGNSIAAMEVSTHSSSSLACSSSSGVTYSGGQPKLSPRAQKLQMAMLATISKEWQLVADKGSAAAPKEKEAGTSVSYVARV